MTEKPNTRRRFLALSGSATLAGLAGCTDRLDLDASEDDETGSSNEPRSENDEQGETNSYEPPTLTVETEYDSREEFRQPGESFDDFEDLDVWETIEGTAEPDEDTVFDGSQSLKLTAEDGENVIVERSIETADLTDYELSLAVRTSTPSNVAIDIRLVDIYGGYAHHQLRSVTYRTPDIGWFRTNPGVFEESTTPLERDVVDEIQLIVYNTGDAEVWVDDLRLHEKPEKGYVVLCWDDGFADFYDTASPLHDAYGVNAVQAAVRQWTRGQRDGVMTTQQLLERQEAGDQIVAHGTHTHLAEMDPESLEDSLRRDKNWAVQNEFEGGHYIVYPHNSFDQTVLDVVSDYYYAGGFNQSGDVNLTGVHGFDPLVLPRTIGHDLDISMRCVDLAARHRQCSILNFHAFDLDNTLDENEYERLLEHIESKGDDLEVIDFDDLWTMRRNGH
ncbi:polysaccharide deacetylase family protein [Natronococcus occultus]|uniref:Polysaccharide deacetylase n=1 Tax=Natronococcus occultus SP4 TaxID=694430 RepID=L0JXM9_9EURY|nr:polysaccharide deacetylase family protein [Natronococcus occultus]AGB37065.1 Polysaccharide deacetylase [Natronococcus occultus SP4]